MTKYPDLFNALARPFHPDNVKQLPPKGGKVFNYITARSVMNRLDEVLGPENWTEEYFPNENSVLCRLTITLPDGSKVVKVDAGAYAGMSDQGDDDKSGVSDAFKRAAVKLGVFRAQGYNEGMVWFREGVTYADLLAADGEVPGPPLTPPARPAASNPPRTQQAPQKGARPPAAASPKSFPPAMEKLIANPPTSGKALFRWGKGIEEAMDLDVINAINRWGKLNGLDGKMVEWDSGSVALAVDQVLAMIGVPVEQAPANEADLKPLKMELYDVIREIATVNTGNNPPTEQSIKEHLIEFSGRSQGGEIIESLKACDSRELLEEVLEICRVELNDIRGAAFK